MRVLVVASFLAACSFVSASNVDWKYSTSLSYVPQDSVFDKTYEYIVTLASAAVDFFDPYSARQLGSVKLPLPATTVAVWNGFVVVGHDAYVSVIKCSGSRQAFHAALLYTAPVPGTINNVALGGDGVAILFIDGQWPGFFSLDVATKNVTHHSDSASWGQMSSAVHPSGTHVYFATNQLSPQQLYDMALPSLTETGSPYWGDYYFGSSFWFTADGQRLIGGSGNTFTAAPGSPTDMQYAGSLHTAVTSAFQAAAHHHWFLAAIDGGATLCQVSYPYLDLELNITTSLHASSFTVSDVFEDANATIVAAVGVSANDGLAYVVTMANPFA